MVILNFQISQGSVAT